MILCTVPSADVGDALAKKLVEARHAACVNRLGPIRSTYRWEETIHVDEEHQLLIKTTREAVDRVREMVAAEHPYDVPELIALDADVLTEPYASWLRPQVG